MDSHWINEDGQGDPLSGHPERSRYGTSLSLLGRAVLSQSWQTWTLCAMLRRSLVGASRHGRFEKGTRADRKRLGRDPRVANLYFCECNKEGYLGEKQGRSCFSVPTEAKLINYTSLWSTVPGSCPDLPGISSSPRRSCCCPHQRGLDLIHNLPFLIRPRDEGDDY